MNLKFRKMLLLEKTILEKEANSHSQGYATNVIDRNLKKQVTNLIEKINLQ